MDTVMSAAYQAGFRSEEQLLIVTSIASANPPCISRPATGSPSSDIGPAGSQLGVQGPGWVYGGDGSAAARGPGAVADQLAVVAAVRRRNGRRPVPGGPLCLHDLQGRHGLQPWDTYRGGAAQRHWDNAVDGWPALRPEVQAFLRSRGASGAVASASVSSGTQHTVAWDGTLWKIARQYYGDGDLWPRLAAANGVRVPEQLHPGTVLDIP
jgi:nucleoid-associated protein YgaU